MSDRLRHKPPIKAGILILAMVFAPLIAGTAGMFMWFIPNGDLRLPAALIGGSYVLLIVLLNSVVGGVNYADRWRQQGGGARQALGVLAGLLMIGFLSFSAAFRAAPAEFTKLLGHPAARSFGVTEIFRHTSRASALCPYTVTLKSLQGDAGTDFCVNVESANRLHVGDHVTLRGRETYFGFKFDSYSG